MVGERSYGYLPHLPPARFAALLPKDAVTQLFSRFDAMDCFITQAVVPMMQLHFATWSLA